MTLGATLPSIASPLLARLSRTLVGVSDEIGDAIRVVNFLRGRLELTTRPDDVFVVTYPRSGTTWLQFILHLMTSDGRMDFEHISEVTPWFERSLAVGALSAADLEALPSPRVFKSHLPYFWLPKGARYIYAIRDGRDVAVSYYHLHRSHLGYQGSFDAFFERFLRGELQYRTWFKHVQGWRARAGDPRVLLLRYEKLKSDTGRCVDEIAAFLGLELQPQRRQMVLERSSFEFMKAHEEKFDFATELLLQRGVHRRSFVRRGQVGEGHASLTDSQQRAFSRAAGKRLALPGVELALPDFLH